MLTITDAEYASANSIAVRVITEADAAVRAFDISAHNALLILVADRENAYRANRARAVLAKACKKWAADVVGVFVHEGLPIGTLPNIQQEAQTILSRTYKEIKAYEDLVLRGPADSGLEKTIEDRARAAARSLHRLVELLTVSSLRSRLVKKALSTNPNAVFVYTGTETGSNSRPFCRDLAAEPNRAFSAQEIIALTPDKPGDSIFNGGGWGCRHLWIPIFSIKTGGEEF